MALCNASHWMKYLSFIAISRPMSLNGIIILHIRQDMDTDRWTHRMYLAFGILQTWVNSLVLNIAECLTLEQYI